MDYSISTELLSLITQIGVGNFLLVLLGIFTVTSAPNIVDKILTARKNKIQDIEYAKDMSFIKSGIDNIWDSSRSSNSDFIKFQKELSLQAQRLKDYIEIAQTQNSNRLDENTAMTENLINIINSIDSIEKMMRNVMSEKDAIGLVGLKMGSVEDFKTRLALKIMEIIDSEDSSGQIELDLNAVIRTEWLDLKSEFSAFNTPFKMRTFLNTYDENLWKEDGLFSIITNIAINDLEPNKKKDKILKQMDMGIRSMIAELVKILDSK